MSRWSLGVFLALYGSTVTADLRRLTASVLEAVVAFFVEEPPPEQTYDVAVLERDIFVGGQRISSLARNSEDDWRPWEEDVAPALRLLRTQPLSHSVVHIYFDVGSFRLRETALHAAAQAGFESAEVVIGDQTVTFAFPEPCCAIRNAFATPRHELRWKLDIYREFEPNACGYSVPASPSMPRKMQATWDCDHIVVVPEVRLSNDRVALAINGNVVWKARRASTDPNTWVSSDGTRLLESLIEHHERFPKLEHICVGVADDVSDHDFIELARWVQTNTASWFPILEACSR